MSEDVWFEVLIGSSISICSLIYSVIVIYSLGFWRGISSSICICYFISDYSNVVISKSSALSTFLLLTLSAYYVASSFWLIPSDFFSETAVSYYLVNLFYFYLYCSRIISTRSLLFRCFYFFRSGCFPFNFSATYCLFLSSSFSLGFLGASLTCFVEERGVDCGLKDEFDFMLLVEMGSRVDGLTRWPLSLTVKAGCGLGGPAFLTT